MPKKILAIFINCFLLFVIISNNICKCEESTESSIITNVTNENSNNNAINETDSNKIVNQPLEKEKINQINSTLEKSGTLKQSGNQIIGKHVILNIINIILTRYYQIKIKVFFLMHDYIL